MTEPESENKQLKQLKKEEKQYALDEQQKTSGKKKISDKKLHRHKEVLPVLANLDALVDVLASQIKVSAPRDIKGWSHTANRCCFWEACHPRDALSHESSVQHLKRYLHDRVQWIDAHVDEVDNHSLMPNWEVNIPG